MQQTALRTRQTCGGCGEQFDSSPTIQVREVGWHIDCFRREQTWMREERDVRERRPYSYQSALTATPAAPLDPEVRELALDQERDAARGVRQDAERLGGMRVLSADRLPTGLDPSMGAGSQDVGQWLADGNADPALVYERDHEFEDQPNWVADVIAGLSERQQRAFFLVMSERMTYRAAGEAMGINHQRVGQLIERCRDAVQEAAIERSEDASH